MSRNVNVPDNAIVIVLTPIQASSLYWFMAVVMRLAWAKPLQETVWRKIQNACGAR